MLAVYSYCLVTIRMLYIHAQHGTRSVYTCIPALGSIGAMIGGPIAGWISDRMGRKPALMLVSIPYLTGYLMITYARFASDAVLFKVVLLIGRFLSGVGIGWASLAAIVSQGTSP